MIFKSKYKRGKNKSKKIWECPHDLGVGKDSLNNTKSTTIKRKKDELDYIKITNFCSSLLRVKRQPTEWENMLAIKNPTKN